MSATSGARRTWNIWRQRWVRSMPSSEAPTTTCRFARREDARGGRPLHIRHRSRRPGLPGIPAGTLGYDDLMKSAVDVDLDGLVVAVASIDDLIRMKRAAGRPRDLAELEIRARCARSHPREETRERTRLLGSQRGIGGGLVLVDEPRLGGDAILHMPHVDAPASERMRMLPPLLDHGDRVLVVGEQVNPSPNVPFVSSMSWAKVPKTASLPARSPESGPLPAWCHAMSSAKSDETVSMSPAANAA